MDLKLPCGSRFTIAAFAMTWCAVISVPVVAAQSEAATSPSPIVAAQAAQPVYPTSSSSIAPVPNATKQSLHDESSKSDQYQAIDPSLVKLGAGDLIDVSVYNIPELATKARIGNNGDVYLPLINYVHVADLTVEEAQSLIEKRLDDGGFVRSPHVTIFVDEASSQGVTVLGEVSKPGVYPDTGDQKLYELISEAGGFTPSAARKVSIARRNQEQPINLDLPRNLGDDLTNNVEIFPGDTIMIPRAPIIYVVGDVARPSGLLVDNGTLTVLQAIALAGGTNKTAKMGGVRIIHKSPAGMTEKTVPLKKMLEAKAPDVPLEGDDILFVPVSSARAAASKTLDAAMTMATAVSIYAVHP